MTTDLIPTTTQSTDEKRGLALLKAVGLDKAAPEQRELALAIADRYGLDLMLKHLVMVEGKPFITRDGLLWVAHRSGQFDGIEVTRPVKEDRFWRCTATVWRKDMTRPTVYPGRFPAGAKNDEEMAIKTAESMALRRAFNVSAPSLDERWASDDADVPPPQAKAKSLTELARLRAGAVAPAQDAPGPEPEPAAPTGAAPEPEPAEEGRATALCDAKSDEQLGAVEDCALPAGHEGQPGPRRHQSAGGTVWPIAKGAKP